MLQQFHCKILIAWSCSPSSGWLAAVSSWLAVVIGGAAVCSDCVLARGLPSLALCSLMPVLSLVLPEG
ncbi:hypothetical protein E2C01_061827 [Portunus trituberculatus]|uniref:Uncharacterized protein n=1 Tax=Portunus trituberculatus TaxID=210409 RepID=A0A5B7HCY0_PORTR|nr:hypothetical protein [Portunus trituberculatus]